MLLITACAVIAMLFMQPIAQDPAYHHFADHRHLFGIDNFLNVVSNAPFLIIALLGFRQVQKSAALPADSVRFTSIYLTFFTGVLLTGLGSSYYHYAPSSSTLIWDRLPMTIAFMAFFCLIIGYHSSQKIAKIALAPLLALGLGSILYWIYTENQGRGDLRLYVLVQFLPILLVPMMIHGSSSKNMDRKSVWTIIAYYGMAKVFEHFDSQIYTLLGEISGHSIKHVLAAMGTYHVYLSLKKETENKALG
jgi:hypothetical protein